MTIIFDCSVNEIYYICICTYVVDRAGEPRVSLPDKEAKGAQPAFIRRDFFNRRISEVVELTFGVDAREHPACFQNLFWW